ncbi:MAG: aldose 1-epimerase family protein, partial [Nocardioides sp.]
PGTVDGWELTLPASLRLVVDDRMLPVGEQPVDGTAYDFRVSRPVGAAVLDDGFGELGRDESGVATAEVRDGVTGLGVALWADAAHRWLQVFSADGQGARSRHGLAVEPMTAPADAFRSGRDLVTLAPGGSAGDEHSASWGIRALG